MIYRPVLDENGMPLIQTDANGRRAIRCVDESGNSVWRPVEEFQTRPDVGAEGAAPADDLSLAPAPAEALDVDLAHEEAAAQTAEPSSAPAPVVVELEAEAPTAPAPTPAPAAPATNGNGNPLCPFCRQAVLPNGEGALAPVSCDLCGTPYHAECWQENGGRCSVYGCRSRAANGAGPADLHGVPAEVADLPAVWAPAPLPRPAGPATTPAPAPADVIYPPASGPAPNRRPNGPTRPPAGRPSPAVPAAPQGRPARDEETPEERAARAELNRLRLQRQAEEERARIAAAEARRRQLWEQEHRVEVEAARRLEEERTALALREERRRAVPPRPGWKVIGGLFLGGIVAILVGAALHIGAGESPRLVAYGECGGVIFGVIWWRLEVARWGRERQEREAEERRRRVREELEARRPGPAAPADAE